MLTKKVILIVLTIVISIIVLTAGFLLRNNKHITLTYCQYVTPKPTFGPVELPKAPHWDQPRKTIYFVDVYKSAVHKYVPKTGIHKFVNIGNGELAFVIPITNTTNKFIISRGPNLAIVTWDGESDKVDVTNIIKIGLSGEDTYRANEGKVSPSGSLFIGTHSPFDKDGKFTYNNAGLYAYYKNNTFKKILSDVTVSNGMQWSADAKKFYYIDSLAYTVESFNYDINTDELSNRALLCNFTEMQIPGVPDGMTIDNEGMIWVTAFNGALVLRINPETKEVIDRISLDAYQITSAVFAGSGLRDFYITSGDYKLSTGIKKGYPHSGWIYRISDFGVSGQKAGVSFDMDLSSLSR